MNQATGIISHDICPISLVPIDRPAQAPVLSGISMQRTTTLQYHSTPSTGSGEKTEGPHSALVFFLLFFLRLTDGATLANTP